MKRIERLAKEYAAPEFLNEFEGYAVDAPEAFEAGYRQALEDAADLCDQGDGSMSSLRETIIGNDFRDRIRALADEEDTDEPRT